MANVRPRRKNPRNSTSGHYSSAEGEHKQHKLHRDLAEFEDFQTILKAVRKDLKAGMNEKQLREKYAPLAQARIISEMLTSDEVGAALSAAKDMLDRTEGKATEKKVVEHRFKDLSDQELEAILKSEEEDLKNMEQKFNQ